MSKPNPRTPSEQTVVQGAAVQYARFFGVLLFATALPFAVFVGLALILLRLPALDSGPLLALAVASGVCFGLFVSIFMGVGQILTTRRFNAGPEGLAVLQVQEIELDGSADRAVSACAEAVRALPKTKVTKVNLEAHSIRARHGLTWRSWTDEIEIAVRDGSKGTSFIQVSSRPRLRTILVDWGSNLRNVTAIRDHLVQRGGRSMSGGNT